MPAPTVIETYKTLSEQYKAQYETLQKRHNALSILRLVIVIAAIALYYNFGTTYNYISLVIAIILTLAFLMLMKIHQQTGNKKLFAKTLQTINEEEFAYLTTQKLSFYDGAVFAQDNHAYSADLDLFGKRSLYQHLNRTATEMGREVLADNLLKAAAPDTIIEVQKATAELTTKLEDRQALYAAGKIANDNEGIYKQLVNWTEEDNSNVPKTLLVLCYILPAGLIIAIAMYFMTKQDIYWSIINKLVPLNLVIYFIQFKNIRKALFSTEKINEMLKSYASMLFQIETASYESTYLKGLQEKLKTDKTQASVLLQELGGIFSKMETVQNPFSAFAMNGLFLYHIHQLNNLNKWKQKHKKQVTQWLQVIGSFEMLNCIANLKYNNPSFCFPRINNNHKISFENLGHPLIADDKRVCNDVSFEDNRFIILTGSNMSGKSTFLRTLGVNMVLAGMGAPVCATTADIHPLSIFVSMRQSDSLADSESYFFAEVKRLKYIMEQLKDEVCFVLLDEILRGTNSDDKRSGTIGVIEKIIKRKAIGAIATHDLEVCLTTDQHPGILTNQCFEVEIINNELVFDYKLRVGICKNKSATFLMKKMEII
ncbi:DNA mismatch repair protein [Taibaiella lutea]|uniref:DNA mismatch repair protein n=1 Tax=Taibaiella lutea TaxID=2608001 RepID=A0A5M6CLU6_9BACT|nr:DNA mismatch repair protein [Taibaiella lutea]KAA5536198.1 DNA mismatch repair protein [Taibaiella lutea]